MDAWAIVAMLEFASENKGQVFGKPSSHFFALTLNNLNLSADQVVMIGDGSVFDIISAKQTDIRAVLVITEKYSPVDLDRIDVKHSAY
jgi:ribonucleotide monophosphatase NagD (HAD superfamily)